MHYCEGVENKEYRNSPYACHGPKNHDNVGIKPYCSWNGDPLLESPGGRSTRMSQLLYILIQSVWTHGDVPYLDWYTYHGKNGEDLAYFSPYSPPHARKHNLPWPTYIIYTAWPQLH